MGSIIYTNLEDFYIKCFKYNSINSMAKGEGVADSTIFSYLNKLGDLDIEKQKEIKEFWKLRRKENNFGIYKDRTTYDLNDKAFDVLTPESAYWLGMLASDGCVYENRNKIYIIAKEEDEGHIEEFRKFIKYTCPLKHRDSKCRDKVFRSVYLEIYSKYMKNILINKYGIVPKKSNKDIDFFRYIPDEFKLYFLFGYFDGDGSIFISKNLSIEITGNYSFLLSVKKFLENNYYIKSELLCRERNGFATKYDLKLIQIYSLYLFSYLYLDFGKECLLKRKYNKMIDAHSILKTKVDNNENLKYNSGLFIDIRKNKKIIKDNVCKNCGIFISRGGEFCKECSYKMKRKVERPPRDILKFDIRNYPFIKLSEKYGVTDNAIRKWCKSYNLPYKSTVIKSISDYEWVNI